MNDCLKNRTMKWLLKIDAFTRVKLKIQKKKNKKWFPILLVTGILLTVNERNNICTQVIQKRLR